MENKKPEEKLAELFDIPTLGKEIVKQTLPSDPEIISNSPSNVIDINTDKKLDDDFEFIRQNLKELISKNNIAIEGILELAPETDKPSAYEAIATLINSSVEANNKLMEVHQKLKQIKSMAEGKKTENNITNNSIFVGNTKDLLALLKKNKNA